MYSVSIDFEGHKVAGWADLCGPYAECEGSEVTSVTPANNDKDFRDRALSAVEEAAYKQHQEGSSTIIVQVTGMQGHQAGICTITRTRRLVLTTGETPNLESIAAASTRLIPPFREGSETLFT